MIDLSQLPYREYVELLGELRRDDAAREWVAFQKTVEDQRGTYDANEQDRARVAFLMHVDPVDDINFVRFMLDQEITARQSDSFQGGGDVLTMLSLRLLELSDGNPDDIWRFWSAKSANFDTIAGGYDIEFVFALGSADEVRRVVEERGSTRNVAFLAKYDDVAIVAELSEWRARLVKRYPTELADFTLQDAAYWAELFGDDEALERHSLALAATPKDRAYAYRNLQRFDAAVDEWRAAAAEATTDWDRASMLQRALSDAAQVPVSMLDEVAQLDALRSKIPEWNGIGLGRMATQACYELAAAVTEAGAGHTLWQTAERWRHDLTSFTLAGLQAAVAAAEKWGAPDEVAELREAARAEKARIDQMLAG